MERWKRKGTADLRGCVHVTGGAQAHVVCSTIIVILPPLISEAGSLQQTH